MNRFGCVDEHPRFDAKARGECLDLPQVETAAAGQHLGDDALAADLWGILLSEPATRQSGEDRLEV
jgi:hypothetical protein